MTTNTERMSKIYPKVREALREIYPDFPWARFYEADRAVNWELWHGPLPDNYWTYVEPLEVYQWKGYEQGLKDIQDMLDNLPSVVWYDGDAEWISLSDPDDDDFYWAWDCKHCDTMIRDIDNKWIDDCESVECDAEGKSNHEPDYDREPVWLGGYEWYKIDTAQATLYDEVWKML